MVNVIENELAWLHALRQRDDAMAVELWESFSDDERNDIAWAMAGQTAGLLGGIAKSMGRDIDGVWDEFATRARAGLPIGTQGREQ